LTDAPAERERTGRAAGAGEAPLLAVEGLEVAFPTRRGRVAALRGVNLALRPGEIVALVGESGSGKSTVGNALMGLLPPGAQARIGGRALFRQRDGSTVDLLSLGRAAMRRIRGGEIAMIFQEPLSSLNPVFTIGGQIVEAIRAHRGVSRGEARAEALGLLEMLGLPSPAKCLASYPHQISGGMRQRVMIAMAISCNPTMLIADEPTTALDVTIQAQIIDLLKDLQARTGMAILFITHDLGLVSEIADRVMVMYGGQIVETAPTRDVFARPLMPYTRALLDAVPEPGCSTRPGYRLDPISGQPPNPAAIPPGCAFHPRCAFRVDACSARAPALEEAGEGRRVRCLRWRELSLGRQE
jgi:oligopeptide transport system ATP-binding protein